MSQFKKKLTAFTAMLAFLSVSGTAAFALSESDMLGKTDNMYVGGNSTKMDININGATGAVGQVDWARFNVASGQTVNFGFSKHSQTIINRVLGGSMSEIYGKLTNSCLGTNCADPYSGTGKVILINPAGVMYGAGSTVDLNSFTTSTFDFNNARNLAKLSDSEKSNYQLDILNKMSPIAAINKENKSFGDITFDSHYTQAFDQYNKPFTHNGVNYNGITINPNAKIVLDGTAFARFNTDGTVNVNNKTKAIAFVGNHIDYKNSLVRAGSNFNYSYLTDQDDPNSKVYESYGSIKLITADGVTFTYSNIGSIYGKDVKADKRTDVSRTIKMDNEKIAETITKYGYGNKAGNEALRGGDVDIYNVSTKGGTTDGTAEINIKNSVIKATKLVNGENGELYIQGSHDINIENSRLDTINTNVTLAGTTSYTKTKDGGKLTVVADGNLTVKDSAILTAGSTHSNTTNGEVKLYSNHGNVTVNGTEIVSDGNVNVVANKNVSMNNTMIEASNDHIPTEKKDIIVKGWDNITAHNTKLVASQGDLILLSDYAPSTNNIIITSDLNNGHNQSLLYAKGKMSIQGKNTTLDNTTLSYNNLKFYNDGSSIVNNVTIKNNTNFATPDGTADRTDIALTTNGNLTFDHATAQAATETFNFTRNAAGDIVDDGYQTNIGYTFADTAYNANNLTATSTAGNVNVQNQSGIIVNDKATLNSQNANVNITKSGIIAGNTIDSTSKVDTNIDNSTLIAVNQDVDIKATTGNIEVKNNSQLTSENRDVKVTATAGKVAVRNSDAEAENDIVITAGTDTVLEKADLNAVENVKTYANNGAMYVKNNTKIRAKNVLAQSKDSITFGKDGSGRNVEKNSDIIATKNITFKSTAGNINSEKVDTTKLTYNTLTFDAAGSNNFTSRTAAGSDGSLQSVNVTYKAGVANNFTTDGDIRFVNSTLAGKTNNITTVGDHADVLLNNLTITNEGTGIAANAVKTYIVANGDVTTEDSVGDLSTLAGKAQHVFPQDVDVDVDPAAGVPNPNGPYVDVKGTKLSIKTNVVKNETNDPSNGSVTLNIKGTAANAGLEIMATNSPEWDGNVDTLQGPEVHIKSADGKPIAISKIITDKLWLNANDEFVASNIEDTSGMKLEGFAAHGANTSKGYIEVRDYAGFNLDKIVTSPDGIVYDDSFEPGTRSDGTGGTIDTFEKHRIHFENNGEDFMLVYTKPDTGCEPNPPGPGVEASEDINQVAEAIESYIAFIRIPKEIVETSKVSSVADATVDQTANVMAAAAKIDLGQEADAEYEDEKEAEE